MQIEIDDEASDQTTIRGTVHGAPIGAMEVAVEAICTTPFGASTERFGSALTGDGRFELARPTWPTSRRGELLSVEWQVVALAAGQDTAATTFDVPAERIEIVSPANDVDDQPAHALDGWVLFVGGVLGGVGLVGVVVGIATDRTWMWVLAGFLLFFAGVALSGSIANLRRRTAFGNVRCTVEPADGRLECTVVTDAPHDLDDVRGTATLLIAEMARRSNADRAGSEHEHVIVRRSVDLTPAVHNSWHGSIAVSDDDLPPSWYHRDESIASAVSWVVRLTLSDGRAPDFVKVVPLLALPVDLDDALRPKFVDVPKAAQRAST